MIRNYSQHVYPNPFRYRKVKNNEFEMLEELRKKLKPFLLNKFSEIDEYFDECYDLKSEAYITRLIRNSIKDKFDSIIEKAKSNFVSKRFVNYFVKYKEDLNCLDTYQKNLRYLELPLQPLVDKEGYEIQYLSNEILDNILEEIDTGMSYIYDYCADFLPESIDLWEDYALLNQNDFPSMSHDYMLEVTYSSFDKIFSKLQKGMLNASNWVISGDINSRVLKIVKPKLDVEDLTYLFRTIIESLISLVLLSLIIKYTINKLKPLLNAQRRRLLLINPTKMLRKAKKTLIFKKFRLQQKVRHIKIKLNTLSFHLNFKYKLLQLMFNKSIL